MFFKILVGGEVLFSLGLLSLLLNKRDVVKVVMSIELMLLGLTYSMVISGFIIDDLMGEVIAVFILTVAAAESAIGLGVLILYFRVSGNVDMRHLNMIQQ